MSASSGVSGAADLISAVWPRTTVDENNLKVHISALRRALSDRNRTYLATVAGRGYRFIAPVEQAGHAAAPSPAGLEIGQLYPARLHGWSIATTP